MAGRGYVVGVGRSKVELIICNRIYRYLAFIGMVDIIHLSILPIHTMLRVNSSQQAGQILMTRRKALGLSQASLAACLGISQNRFSELEAHAERLTLERLLALASQLGLEVVLQEKTPPATHSEW